MKLKSLKIRIYPNATQMVQLNKTFGCVRFIYNQMLGERKETYEKLKDKPRELYEYDYRTERQIKEEFGFLKEVDSIALQQARIDLSHAYQNFFRKARDPKIPSGEKGFPRFKRKGQKNSFRTILVGSNLKVDFEKRKIKAPKLGWVPFRDNRKIENLKIHSMTFSRTPTLKYYVSILYEDVSPNVQKPEIDPKTSKIAGLDMSLTNFFVDDNGNSPEYAGLYRKYEKKIAELQRKISISKNTQFRKKMRLRLNRIHEHIKNARKDFIEKLSTDLVRKNDVIVIETLSLKDMAKFRTWNERNGSSNPFNHGKSVSDLGWGCFVSRLKTKAEEHGKIVIEANRWFASSKTCNVCGYVNKDLTVPDRTWTCPKCRTIHMRDVNSAINLKNIALEIFTEGTSGSAGNSRNRSHLQ